MEAETRIKVEFGDVSFGARAAATTLKFGISNEEPARHVGQCYMEYRKRRLIGRIVLGDEMPEQSSFLDRNVIDGIFDTHNPSFGDDYVSLRITFDSSEIEPSKLIEFRHKSGWILIESIKEIPKPEKKTDSGKTLWEGEPIARLGIDNKLVQKLFDNEIKDIGDLIGLALGHQDISFSSIGIAKGRQETILEKLGLFFEDQGIDNPIDLSAKEGGGE